MMLMRNTAPKVFSAHAEVVPLTPRTSPEQVSILRARGGSSGHNVAVYFNQEYSPRTRR